MTTFSAVVTTGIYCRPGCGARPNADNVRTFDLAAAAEAAGYRACLRCRPYRITGSMPWHAPELVCRAVQLIINGALDDGTEADLGRALGLSARHLRRLFHEHLGLTPDQLARSRRAHFARRLLDDTDLTVADIAFASGFGSLRQFNRTMRETFRASPVQLRQRRRRADRLVADGGLTLRVPVTTPYDWPAMLDFLAARAIPGVESVESDVYRRTIILDGGPGLLEVGPGGHDHLLLRAHLPYWEGLIHVVERVGRMLDADADPAAPRIPRGWAPFEAGVHIVIAQHCDHTETRAHLGRLAKALGPEIPGLSHRLTHAFPSAATLSEADLDLSPVIAEPVRALARAVADGDVRLDGSAGTGTLIASLTEIPGIGATAAKELARRV